jgi:hypothetical protein
MVLGSHQHLPLILRRVAEVGTGVADEVPQDVLLQLGLAVRRVPQLVETGQERPGGILIAPVHPAVPPPPGPGIRLGRSDLIDQVAQTADDDFGDGHG